MIGDARDLIRRLARDVAREAARELAQTQAQQDRQRRRRGPGVQVKHRPATAVTVGPPPTVTVDDDGAAVTMPILDGYWPRVGDMVRIEKVGPDWVAVGRILTGARRTPIGIFYGLSGVTITTAGPVHALNVSILDPGWPYIVQVAVHALSNTNSGGAAVEFDLLTSLAGSFARGVRMQLDGRHSYALSHLTGPRTGPCTFEVFLSRLAGGAAGSADVVGDPRYSYAFVTLLPA